MTDHACKWHEHDNALEVWMCKLCMAAYIRKEDAQSCHRMEPEEILNVVGCQNCSRPYQTKTCEDCGLEFIDWNASGDPDVFVRPYVTSSGDLYCHRCGPDYERENEEDTDDIEFYEGDGII